jgi:hypothetical protein
MSGQTGYIPTGLPSFPWTQGNDLDATPLNNQFYLMLTTAATQQTSINSLTAQVAALQTPGGGGTSGNAADIIADWAGGATITNGTYVLIAAAVAAFTVGSIVVNDGTNGGSFVVTLSIDGAPIPGLNAIVVTSNQKITINATGTGNVVAIGGELDMIISSVTGAPTNCYVQVNSVTGPIATTGLGIGQAFGTSTAVAVGTYTSAVAPATLILDDPVYGVLDRNPLG